MRKLNIVFILGTLEEHKCGVSDYVRRICEYLDKKDYRCTCIAMNDRYICTENKIRTILAGTDNTELLRLSSKIPWWKRIQYTKKTIEGINPNVVSIQFVPYDFNSKGLALPLVALILIISREIKWHIMFHELWILQYKFDSITSFIKKIIAEAQKTIILTMTYVCKPCIVHVSNYLYQLRLANYGICSDVLPIFSNIPLIPIKEKVSRNKNSWRFVVFGRITEFWNQYELLEKIEKARIKHGIDHCEFLSIGKTSDMGKRIWQDMKDLANGLYPAFTFHYEGEISQKEISLHLQTSDFGLSTTPSALVQKSGSVAAMLRHGLPVIISRITDQNNTLNKSLMERRGFIILDKDFEERLISINKNETPSDSFYEIIEKFQSDLSRSFN